MASWSMSNWPEPHYHKGYAYFRRGKFKLATQSYTHALYRDPKWYMVYDARGMAWHQLGKYDYAIKDFTKAMRNDHIEDLR